jgi:hypothetical protein
MADKKPDMNEFFLRGVPLAIAVEARGRWNTLTDAEKRALGFEPSDSSSSTKLPGGSCPGSLH